MSRAKHGDRDRVKDRKGLQRWRGASMLVLSIALGMMGLNAVAGRPTDVTYLTVLSLVIVAKAVVTLAGESAAAIAIEAPCDHLPRREDGGTHKGEAGHE